jgi:hypothetical protein
MFSKNRLLLWFGFNGADARSTSKIWGALIGSSGGSSPFVHFKAIPRHLNGYFDGTAPRIAAQLRYYPYKQELTVNNNRAVSVDEMLALYLPPMLNDDERVKYVALKNNRTEQEVAMKVFEMRRLKQVVAQTVRNKVRARSMRIVDGQEMSEQEREYQLQAIANTVQLETSFLQCHSFEPILVFSPHYEVGGCIDFLAEAPKNTAARYVMVEVRVDKSLPFAVLPDCIGIPKYPLENFEPTVANILFLKMSILFLIARLEHYVNDNWLDTHHSYNSVIMHLRKDPTGRRNVVVNLHQNIPDFVLARKLLDHYYEHHVVPRRSLRTN